jgi:hypothetical protein
MTATSMEVATDVFRSEYLRLSSSIESSLRSKENFEQAQRDNQIQLDIDRGKVKAHRSQLDLRESQLTQRQEQAGDSDLSAAEKALSQAQSLREQLASEVAALSGQLDRSNSDISETNSQLYGLEASINDVPLYEAAINRLLALIREQSAKLLEAQDLTARTVPILADLKEKEGDLIELKRVTEGQLRALEERKLECSRTLAEPIDPAEDDAAIARLEDDNTKSEARLRSMAADHERSIVGKLSAEIEMLEQENLRRKALVDKKREAVNEQSDNRERKRLEDQRKLQKQREAIERLCQQTDQARSARLAAALRQEEEEEQPLPTPEEHAQRLAEFEGTRQTKLDQLNAEIEDLIAKHDANQKPIEQRWDRKMNRITKYTQRLTKKEKILLQIGEHEEGIVELEQKLETLQRQKQQLTKRKMESVKFSSEYEAEKSRQIIEKANLEGRSRQIADTRKANLARTRDIAGREKDFERRRQEALEEEQAVLELERQLDDINAKAIEAIGKLKAENASIDDTILSLTMGDASND